jgi:2-polyprenyl-3-methyl-5-hydroxy-6-metoxy-1,4-benzoquinol methylase
MDVCLFVARAECIQPRVAQNMTYKFQDEKPSHTSSYLWPALLQEIHSRESTAKRVFDLGCGNGATADMLTKLGFDVTGVDPSASGIEYARTSYPRVKCEIGTAYEDLASIYGKFDIVVSLEVIEHCMEPRMFAKTFLDLIAPGGVGYLSTPYHGYVKNLALAVSGELDRHFTVLWEGGHVKFFSIRTLEQLLREAGAKHIRFKRVGRIPQLAKSMIAVIQG